MRYKRANESKLRITDKNRLLGNVTATSSISGGLHMEQLDPSSSYNSRVTGKLPLPPDTSIAIFAGRRPLKGQIPPNTVGIAGIFLSARTMKWILILRPVDCGVVRLTD